MTNVERVAILNDVKEASEPAQDVHPVEMAITVTELSNILHKHCSETETNEDNQ